MFGCCKRAIRNFVPYPGIEPGSFAWKANILATGLVARVPHRHFGGYGTDRAQGLRRGTAAARSPLSTGAPGSHTAGAPGSHTADSPGSPRMPGCVPGGFILWVSRCREWQPSRARAGTRQPCPDRQSASRQCNHLVRLLWSRVGLSHLER